MASVHNLKKGKGREGKEWEGRGRKGKEFIRYLPKFTPLSHYQTLVQHKYTNILKKETYNFSRNNHFQHRTRRKALATEVVLLELRGVRGRGNPEKRLLQR